MPTLNDYRDREHHSFSSINQFINICSLQYAFQRIYKVPKAFTPVSLIFGSVFHRVMEWVSLSRKEETVKAHEERELCTLHDKAFVWCVGVRGCWRWA